jgi:hypothetical protein
MAEPDLAALQHWTLRHIVGDGLPPDPDPPAGGGQPGAAEFIHGSPRLGPAQRLAIYARSYRLRLVECLREEFPTLRLLVGDQVFDLFAGAYLAACPSTSYSLYRIGTAFVDFLAATRPAHSGGPGTLDAIPASLARLERAISEAQRAVGTENMSDADLVPHPLLPPAPGLRLRLPDTVTLLRLDFDFSDALACARRGERPVQPPARDVCVAVARCRYRVRVHTLEPARFAWLQAIGPQGADGWAAAARVAPAAIADLLAWLPLAAAAGLVVPAQAVPPCNRMASSLR